MGAWYKTHRKQSDRKSYSQVWNIPVTPTRLSGVETFVHTQAGLHSWALSQNQPTNNHKPKLSPMFKRRKYKRMFIEYCLQWRRVQTAQEPSLLIDNIGTVQLVKMWVHSTCKRQVIPWIPGIKKKKKEYVRADVGVHAFNSSSLESGAGTPLWVPGQPRLHSEVLSWGGKIDVYAYCMTRVSSEGATRKCDYGLPWCWELAAWVHTVPLAIHISTQINPGSLDLPDMGGAASAVSETLSARSLNLKVVSRNQCQLCF